MLSQFKYLLIISLGLLAVHVHAASSSAHIRTSLDAAWHFHLDDSAIPESVTINGWSWRAAKGEETRPPTNTTGEGWSQTASGDDTFHGRQGFSWYHATAPNLPKPGRILHFESIDDNGIIFLNGVKLAEHKGWNEPFDVPMDSGWNATGKNSIDILVENTAGGGGIGKAWFQREESLPDTGPAAEIFDDSRWKSVHLPHDFVVEGTFTPTAEASHGSLPVGIGWYRRKIDIPKVDQGKRLWIEFDGVYRNSTVWLNGIRLGTHKSGYTGFRYDITHAVHFGGSNELAVRVDARFPEGWWYEGGGIYRHVWLNTADPVHFAPDSVCVTSAIKEPNTAEISFEAVTVNQSSNMESDEVVTEVHTPDGKLAGTLSQIQNSAPNHSETVKGSIVIPRPMLWSLEHPQLYTLVTRIKRNGNDIDRVVTPFGIRTIRFDANTGFWLNGKNIKIKGTCNHQDFAGMGIAMPDSLLVWRIKKLKEMGSNAYRMSHNPPARELLDACDRMGMLVMDENRHLGDTYRDHSPNGTPYSDLSDLKDLILRDRNHPSIIIWSMCNEEGLQGSEEGARIFGAMKAIVNQLDPTRPVSCARNGSWGEGISNVEDLQGCNYNPGGYDDFHQRFPNKPMYGSETASTVSTRGEYVNDPVKGYVSAYDLNTPSWAQTAEVAWKAIGEKPFMAREFVWTGFDYKGEPTPYGWPCINSHFGIMDICGFPKDNYFYYQAWWGDKPIVHILPHWNWAGKEGQQIDIWVHSNADRVELFLNGKSQGSKEMPKFGHLEWKVPYTPGRLEARGYRNGHLIAKDTVETAGAPAILTLTPDRTSLLANGEEVVMVKAEVLDKDGRVVPYADNEISFSMEGSGDIAGVGNGDPSSHEPDKASKRHAFHGLCMAVIRGGNESGIIALTASAPGLNSAQIEIKTETGSK